jgi:3-oxoacyl-[acyl-carrier protein] reductase
MTNGSSRRALVLGGSGYVGREVVRLLVAEGVTTAFSYRRGKDVAAALAAETGACAYETNLGEPADIRALFERLDADGFVADILVHAAVVSYHGSLADVTDDAEAEMHAVNVRSARIAAQCVSARIGDGGADIAFLAALDGIAKISATAAFAATQSARLGLTHALAKELGPKNIRVNLVLLGALGGGIAAGIEPARLADYRCYSAMQRAGTSVEAARAVRRLVLANRWMTGSTFPVTGGL